MSLFSAIHYALTGQQAESDEDARDPKTLAKKLLQSGWSKEDLLEIRDAAFADERRWPFPVDPAIRGEVGAAQAKACISQVCEHLGLNAKPRLRDASAPLSQHDRQLIEQLPPHHGKVG